MIKIDKQCETRPASGILKMSVTVADYTNVLNLGIGEPGLSGPSWSNYQGQVHTAGCKKETRLGSILQELPTKQRV
jgi:hypothetical protein